MPHFFIKSIKVAVLLILPLFYGSSLHNSATETLNSNEGAYLLKTKGEKEINLQGVVTFDSSIEVGIHGEKYAILKLNLSDTKSINGHSFGFLISRPILSAKLIGVGDYKITSNINGFLDYFEGVFGFANVNAFGETPYFAKSGSISIDDIEQSRIKGYLNIAFENSNGEVMSVSGKFDAARK